MGISRLRCRFPGGPLILVTGFEMLRIHGTSRMKFLTFADDFSDIFPYFPMVHPSAMRHARLEGERPEPAFVKGLVIEHKDKLVGTCWYFFFEFRFEMLVVGLGVLGGLELWAA